MHRDAASRRALFNRFRGGPAQFRPPGTGDEDAFLAACTQCGACITACPTGLLVEGHCGYPIADFSRGECTFCGACAESCADGCFERNEPLAWSLKAAISSACVEPKGVTCRRCADACAASAIVFRPKLGGGAIPSINLDRCNGCGACVVPCPVDAVAMARGANTNIRVHA